MEIQPPYGGLHEGASGEKQPPTTSPFLQNVRPFDTIEERELGQRPGFVKAYDTQIGGAHPVLVITQIAVTYIEPET